MRQPSDPERARIDALLARATEGAATEAEAEELALYARADPSVAARAEAAAANGKLGAGWLERVRKDAAVERIDRSERARIERGVGLGLLAAGYLLHFTAPFVGAPLVGLFTLGFGALVLIYSLVRVRLATHRDDPYKDVIR